MKLTKKTAHQMAQRRAVIVERYLSGERVEDIAKSLGIALRTAFRDITAVLDEYKQRAAKAADELVAEELAKLAKIEVEAWEQWERSKLDAVTDHVSDTTADSIKPDGTVYPKRVVKKEKRVTGKAGDPRFLQVVLNVHEKRAELLGLREHMAAPAVEEFMRRIGDAMREIARLEDAESHDAQQTIGYGGELSGNLH